MVDEAVRTALRRLVDERDWAQFHTPASLARSVVIEAGELLECFQWSDQGDPDAVRDELADVLTYCLLLADKLELDPDAIVLSKLESTQRKYPIDKARGRSTKYDRLPD
ncbi:nucleotide pyrophosphohydrolase [Nocardioides houyundeii]|uniref:nucleotide pyrophosphohydrolase n=1 Tax=Nocardioides houyundeii TaxID=2045452 RepID=UPI000C780925|nr:nucleotide pyrophosphohydrolase [Nocardioides houyundeii]